MLLSIIKKPSAYLPIAMSLTALALVLIHAARYGIVHEADEGTTAHLFQILMAAQVPLVAFFALTWLPEVPGQALASVTRSIRKRGGRARSEADENAGGEPEIVLGAASELRQQVVSLKDAPINFAFFASYSRPSRSASSRSVFGWRANAYASDDFVKTVCAEEIGTHKTRIRNGRKVFTLVNLGQE